MHSNEAEGLTLSQPSNAPHKHHCTTISLPPFKGPRSYIFGIHVGGPSTEDPHGIENRIAQAYSENNGDPYFCMPMTSGHSVFCRRSCVCMAS